VTGYSACCVLHHMLRSCPTLQAQLSGQLGSLGQASLGSVQLSSLGSMLGQPVSRTGSYGAPHSISQDSSSRRISFESLSHFSPGTHSAASMGNRNRGLTEQQVRTCISTDGWL
jgi:hypothetical protein